MVEPGTVEKYRNWMDGYDFVLFIFDFWICDYRLFQKLYKYNEKLKYFHIINELHKQMT